MNGKSYNLEELRSYLLGFASPSETEQIDELSITDSEFADLIGAAEKDLIDSYVQDELRSDVLQRFEEYYLSSPRRREKVRFAQVFKEYSDARISEVWSRRKTDSAAEQKGASVLSRLSRFGRLLSAPTLAVVAAALVLTTFLGWLAVRDRSETGVEIVTNINGNAEIGQSFSSPVPQPSPTPAVDLSLGGTQPTLTPTPENPSPTPKVKIRAQPIIASFVLRPPLRGANVPTVRIPLNAVRASARLELESDDLSSYSVELVNTATGLVVWRHDGIKPRKSNGIASLYLNVPAKILSPSFYTIRATGRSNNGAAEIVGDYPFQVVQ